MQLTWCWNRCIITAFNSPPPQLIVMDMETGVACEAPQSLWDRVATCMDLSPDQVRLRQTW